MSVPEAILSRIRKLSNMTEANGAAAAEAAMALSAIAKLMAEHNIQENDLQLKAFGTACIQRSIWTFGDKPNPCVHVFPTLASVFECKFWVSVDWADPLEIGIPEKCCEYIFFGFPQDAEIAASLAQMCLKAYSKGLEGRPKHLDKASFSAGFIEGLKLQIKAMRPVMNANKSGALVVQKHERVKEEHSALGLRLSTLRSKTVMLDGNAFDQGKVAGNTAQLQSRAEAPAKRIGAA